MTFRRSAAFLLALATTTPAAADQFIMGAGSWPCGEVTRVAQSGSDSEVGQLAGWVLGFWSYATYERDNTFVNTVETVGGRGVFDATVQECAGADAEVLLHVVARSMAENTK